MSWFRTTAVLEANRHGPVRPGHPHQRHTAIQHLDRSGHNEIRMPVRPLTHLQRLEAESIHIFREVVATCDNPVLMYSVGKDSAVLLHLAIKAFYPAPLPFPLLHVDTTWKFREMIEFRDRRAKELGCKLIVHINQDGLRAGVNPFVSGSRLHTDVMKTQGLKQALEIGERRVGKECRP